MKKQLFKRKIAIKNFMTILSVVSLLVSGLLFTVYSKKYDVDSTHSSVGFTVKHLLVSDVDGVFTDYDATLEIVKGEIRKFDLDVSVKSVDTRNNRRDGHLRTDDFFDVDKYPKITFRSEGYKAGGPNQGKLTGELTIKDVKKKMILDVAISNPTQFRGKEVYGISLTGKISRKSFKVGESTSAAVVSDEVTIKVNLEVKN